jgi:lipopolysaccharide export system permease protein
MLTTRYLMKNLLSATIFIALTLTAVVWLTQSLKLLEIVANSDAPPYLFLKLVALSLPRFLEIILPLSLVIAVLFVYNKMIMDNELVVLRSCGCDQYDLARPALLLAAAVSIILVCLTTYVSPLAYAEMQRLRVAVKAQYSSFLLREGVFNTFGKDLTVYARARGEDGGLSGIMIHDTRDKDKPPVTITAKRGAIAMNGDIPEIVVYDGLRQQLDGDSGVITRLYFSRYTIEISSLGNEPRQRWREANERTFSELLRPDMSDRHERANREAFLAEAVNRVVTPFNALTFTIVALAAILLGPFNRRGQNKKVLAAIAAVALLEVLDVVAFNVSKRHLAAAPLLVIFTFIPFFLAAWALHLRGEQRIMLLLRAWNRRSHRQWEAQAA